VVATLTEQEILAELVFARCSDRQLEERRIGDCAGAVILRRAHDDLARHRHSVLIDRHAPPERVNVAEAQRDRFAPPEARIGQELRERTLGASLPRQELYLVV